MGNLRIKLKYKSFEIELEGDKETVQSEFKDIKENGLGNIVNGVDLSEQTYLLDRDQQNLPEPKQLHINQEIETIQSEEENTTSLKDVIMRQLPSTEPEWIIVYAYFVSDKGNKTFTNKDILNMYESTKRSTNNRKKNFSTNLKSLFSKNILSALNNDDFILTDDGKHAANEIITRSHSSKSSQSIPKSKKESKKSTSNNKSTSKGKKSANQFEVLKSLNLRPENNISLADYIETFEISSNSDRIIVIINYLKEVLKLEQVSANHIYTSFWILKCKIPTSFNQVLINTRGRSKYIDYESQDDISLSIPGSNRLRLDINKN